MMKKSYPKILKDTIHLLSQEASYKTLCHRHYLNQPVPSIANLEEIVELLREIIFPGYFGDSPVRPESINYYIGVNTERVFELLSDQIYAGLCFVCTDWNVADIDSKKKEAFELAAEFIGLLPDIRRKLATDVQAAFLGDPAAISHGEVIFCYPAIKAITNYRISHALLNLGVPLLPRIISEMAHSETGIDIHPGAKIGEHFTIDHGTGVVIGATSIIGSGVKIFQGVTLGAKSFPLDDDGNPIKGIPRHPIVEDDVVIYAQATILGRITIGAGSTIGGNVWLTNSVPANSKIVQFKPRDLLYAEGGGI